MTFAAPWMLWSLLALLPLVAVYFLKVRPRRRPTTAYFLWEKIFHERKANRLWQRVRGFVSLLIMAAAFGAIALALAEPRWSDDERSDLLILIDNSASMLAKEPGGTRLELAKEKARGLARALDGVQRAAVATVADRLRYRSHLTDNPRELLAAIDAIEPTNEAFRLSAIPDFSVEKAVEEGSEADDGVDVIDNDAQPQARRRVLLVTDAVLGGSDSPVGIELIRIGGEQSNLGIVAADLQFVPGATDRMSFYFQIASTHEEPVEVDLLLSRQDEAGDSRLAKVIPLTAEPGLNPPQTLTVEGDEPGRWTAELDGEGLSNDALAIDNKAWLVARRPPPISMSVTSDDRYFFEQSVRAFAIGAAALELVEADAEVTLAKGATDAPRSIIFQPTGESPWWEGSVGEDDDTEVGASRILVEGHPVLRHVDPLSISFVGARRLRLPPGAQVLVEADDGTPLIYTSSQADSQAVVVNLDPVAAEFYFSAWFPVLVHASAKHLAGREDPLLAVYKPGDIVRFAPNGVEQQGELTRPSGELVVLSEPATGRLAETGFYEAALTSDRHIVACSLLSAEESLLNAGIDPPEPAALASGGPPGRWFVMLALVAITVESVLYHLRKVG